MEAELVLNPSQRLSIIPHKRPVAIIFAYLKGQLTVFLDAIQFFRTEGINSILKVDEYEDIMDHNEITGAEVSMHDMALSQRVGNGCQLRFDLIALLCCRMAQVISKGCTFNILICHKTIVKIT